MQNTKIIAHRGSSAYRMDNTMPAFELAITQKADAIELDVQMTKDGALVLLHDETVDHAWVGSGAVKDLTYAQLRAMRPRAFPDDAQAYITTLDEVLAFIAPHSLDVIIELKNSIDLFAGMEDKIVALVKRFGMEERVFYTSFNHISLQTIRTIDPKARIGLQYRDILAKPWSYAKSLGAYAILPARNSLWIPNLVRDSHEHGIAVYFWSINDKASMRFCMEQQADGIMTKAPDVARSLV